MAMVREGLGFTRLPEMRLAIQVEGLPLLSAEPPLRFNLGIGVRSGRHVSPAVSRFVQSARSWAHANGFEAQASEKLVRRPLTHHSPA